MKNEYEMIELNYKNPKKGFQESYFIIDGQHRLMFAGEQYRLFSGGSSGMTSVQVINQLLK